MYVKREGSDVQLGGCGQTKQSCARVSVCGCDHPLRKNVRNEQNPLLLLIYFVYRLHECVQMSYL